ncbi:MAG: hypothetical protein KDJ41_09250 [Hyphomicrobiaceae bacterium]|nr:hypothetical protein [Hyphomicrobiaceae bacterium]
MARGSSVANVNIAGRCCRAGRAGLAAVALLLLVLSDAGVARAEPASEVTCRSIIARTSAALATGNDLERTFDRGSLDKIIILALTTGFVGPLQGLGPIVDYSEHSRDQNGQALHCHGTTRHAAADVDWHVWFDKGRDRVTSVRFDIERRVALRPPAPPAARPAPGPRRDRQPQPQAQPRPKPAAVQPPEAIPNTPPRPMAPAPRRAEEGAPPRACGRFPNLC